MVPILIRQDQPSVERLTVWTLLYIETQEEIPHRSELGGGTNSVPVQVAKAGMVSSQRMATRRQQDGAEYKDARAIRAPDYILVFEQAPATTNRQAAYTRRRERVLRIQQHPKLTTLADVKRSDTYG